MTKHELFLKASEIIVINGHCKGTYETNDGRMCILGALGKVGNVSGSGWTDTIYAMRDITGANNVVKWNDAHGRSAGEVIAVLDAAAVIAMQEAGLEPEDVLS